ncbi:BLUF domain-containing protein [Qipengyuania gaetbuli]|uniref:BLUF domain-containing protein n=1 Tax=Qipengyuania gaetbuli TaxID=266952 RepID=UPI001CFD266A|nr:BLUF domain-containing protein [Qipengyuania gaetbuli]
MKRIVYRSTIAAAVDSTEVFNIIDTSNRRNPARGITGFLLHDGERFLQFLEGPPLEVEGLLAEIERDPRHTDLVIVYDEGAQEPWFPDWAMKRLINFTGPPAIDQLREELAGKPDGDRVLGLVEDFLRA